MIKNIFVFYLSFFLFNYAYAQKLSPEVTLGDLKWNANEPSVGINPKNSEQVVLAYNINKLFRFDIKKRKWMIKKMQSKHGVYGDPVIQFDQKGHCYYVHLAKGENKMYPEWFDQIVIQKSIDQGKTWSDGVGVGKNGKMQDKPWISIDESNAKYKGNIYLTWTQFDKYGSREKNDSSRILFSVSRDNGFHFSEPVIISDLSGDCVDGDSTVEGATTCTGVKGEIYAAWAGYEKIFFDKSTDGGNTWHTDKVIMSIPKGWDLKVPDFYRTNGLPFLQSDTNGVLYLITAYEVDGNNRVFFNSCEDGGETWLDKPFALQEEANTNYVMPHACLDKSTGNYYVLYYKIKEGKIDVLLSYKLAKENRFRTIQINNTAFTVINNKIFMGDYIGVNAVGKKVVLVWTEALGINTLVKTRTLLFE